MVIRFALAVGLAFLATGCATAPAGQRIYELQGAPAWMDAAEAAAKTCGYKRYYVTVSHGGPSSVVFEIPESDDPNYSCLARWFEEQSEEGYGRLPAPGR